MESTISSTANNCIEFDDHQIFVLPDDTYVEEELLFNYYISNDADMDSQYDSIDYDDNENYQTGEDWVELATSLEEYLISIQSTLSKHAGYSVDALYEAVLVTNGDLMLSSLYILKTEDAINKAKPCRHKMSGHCARSDCMYDHNLSDIPCRYWLSAVGCKSQDTSCPFIHNLLPPDDNSNYVYDENNQVSDANKQEQRQEELLLDDLSLFPSLHVTKDDLDNSSATANVPWSKSCMTNVAVNQIRSSIYSNTPLSIDNVYDFPSLHDSMTGATIDNSSDLNYHYAEVLQNEYITQEPQHKGTDSYSNSYNGGKECKQKESYSKSTIKSWVESGKSVGKKYQELRKEARELAIARNKFLEEATNAYLGDRKDLAKRLSSKGRELNNLMKECHRTAAKEIFRQRNPESLIRRGQIDLHALHIKESYTCLDEILPALYEETNLEYVSIVTGSGHHSNATSSAQNRGRGESRLLREIKRYLYDYNYTYSLILDKNGFVGGVKVKIRY